MGMRTHKVSNYIQQRSYEIYMAITVYNLTKNEKELEHRKKILKRSSGTTVFEAIVRIYLWWSSCTLYLLACQVRVTVGDSGLCCVCVTSFERKLTPLCVGSKADHTACLNLLHVAVLHLHQAE